MRAHADGERISRRAFVNSIASLGAAAGLALFVGCSLLDRPQKIARVGYLGGGPAQEYRDALQPGLREFGWVEGQNLTMDVRTWDGTDASGVDIAADLVRSVDVVVVGHGPAALAIQRASSSMPIVIATHPDPVGAGLVASLDKPGGMITGLGTSPGGLVFVKRLELLKEMVPSIVRLGLLLNPDFSVATTLQLPTVAATAQQLGMELVLAEVRSDADLPDAFQVLVRERVDALFVINAPNINSRADAIVAFVAESRLPAHCPGWTDLAA
jgi:putative ABC transport system substrate-binding protein